MATSTEKVEESTLNKKTKFFFGKQHFLNQNCVMNEKSLRIAALGKPIFSYISLVLDSGKDFHYFHFFFFVHGIEK